MSSIKERAEKFWRNVPVVHKPIEELIADFALAERKLQREECAEAYQETATSFYVEGGSIYAPQVKQAILAAGVDTPQWCEHIYGKQIDNAWYWFLKTHAHLDGVKVHDNCNNCPFCGKARVTR